MLKGYDKINNISVGTVNVRLIKDFVKLLGWDNKINFIN